MNNDICQQIENSAHYRSFDKTATVCLLTFHHHADYLRRLLFCLSPFAPHWLGTPLHEGTSVTQGIPIGIGVIVISFVLTGVYVWRANGESDRLNKAVLREVKAS